jgi:hypothetical protein
MCTERTTRDWTSKTCSSANYRRSDLRLLTVVAFAMNSRVFSLSVQIRNALAVF